MKDVSGTGLSLIVKASNTYPQGVLLTAFPDDTDPMEFDDLTITEYGMGLNGDLVTWSAPQALPFKLSLIPNTPGEIAMNYLLEANRVAKGKRSARDVITIIAKYADGTKKTLKNGKIVSGPPSLGVTSGGRIKTPTYGFVFENQA